MQFLPGSSSHLQASMRPNSVVLLPNHHLYHRRLTRTRLSLLLPVQVRYRCPHKSVRSIRLCLLVLTVVLHHRNSNSRTRVSHRRFPPARPVAPLRLGLTRVLEVSKPACHRPVLLAKAKEPLPPSIVSFFTLILVEAEEFPFHSSW